MMVTVSVMIVLLSVGAPGVPGSAAIMLTILLEEMAVPLDGIALIMSISPILGMLICTLNCMGDRMITTFIAKKENLMDMNVYFKKK
jgi:Na+/H+-dicarboxylate symporter